MQDFSLPFYGIKNGLESFFQAIIFYDFQLNITCYRA